MDEDTGIEHWCACDKSDCRIIIPHLHGLGSHRIIEGFSEAVDVGLVVVVVPACEYKVRTTTDLGIFAFRSAIMVATDLEIFLCDFFQRVGEDKRGRDPSH